jgi:hypothetical protein
MPKPVSWSNRIYDIRQRVRNAKLQTWSRRDIEDLFEVRRATAITLMKSIGNLQIIGGTHFVDRANLLEFVEQAEQAEDLTGSVRSRRLEAGPAPKPSKLNYSLPTELKTVMALDLPKNIRLEEGRLTITGADSAEVIAGLYALAQALQNDLGSIQAQLDPVPKRREVGNDELRSFFAQLERKELEKKKV